MESKEGRIRRTEGYFARITQDQVEVRAGDRVDEGGENRGEKKENCETGVSLGPPEAKTTDWESLIQSPSQSSPGTVKGTTQGVVVGTNEKRNCKRGEAPEDKDSKTAYLDPKKVQVSHDELSA